MKLISFSVVAVLMLGVTVLHASTTISYQLGELTSAGNPIANGTLFIISSGADGIFDSTPSSWISSGTSITGGDDILLTATQIGAGDATSDWIESYQNGVVAGQKIEALFFNGLTQDQVNYSTGMLINGYSFANSGGTSYGFGTYRTDATETLNGAVSDPIPWVLPADAGSTASLDAYTGTGEYTGNDITATLNTTALVSVVPEPSSYALLGMGFLTLLLAVRRCKTPEKI